MSRFSRIGLAALLALVLGGLAAGCGGSDLGDIDEGQSFEMGELRYNVLYDRFLNAADVEDAPYLAGEPAQPNGKQYFGVFVLIDNQSDDEFTLPDRGDFKMTDTTGAEYTPIDLSNEFGFPFGEVIEGDSEVPSPDSIAAAGPTQGSLVVFLVDANVSENRPLLLHITNQGEDATIKLDL